MATFTNFYDNQYFWYLFGCPHISSWNTKAIVFYPGSDRWTPARGDTTGWWRLLLICVWNCNMNSALGPVAPLAMFIVVVDNSFFQLFLVLILGRTWEIGSTFSAAYLSAGYFNLLRKNCQVLKYILNLFPSPGPPPYPILWPTLTQYGLTIVRLVLGL